MADRPEVWIGRMDVSFPGRDRLADATETTVADLPTAARVSRTRDQPAPVDVERATVEAVAELPALAALDDGDAVAVTAGSRGITDMPVVLESIVGELQSRGLAPFVFPAMGSHGGATAGGQRETLEALGITPSRLGCEIRSSMDVEAVGTDRTGQPVYASADALDADAIVLVNRVKPHTDFRGDVESGLCKMAVIGLGKQRGADNMHNAALDRGFEDVIEERTRILVEETPVVGGVALVENADERAVRVEGVPASDLLDVEPALLDRARELLPTLPVDDLDLLVVDEIGKDVSGTGLDTNVLGRVRFHGQAEPDRPSVTRVYARSLTPASHGNALGMGLADLVHRDLAAAVDFGDTYVNIVTSGEPERAKLPLVVPDDATAFTLAASMTGVHDASELRIARIENTLEPDELWVSEPVADELRGRPDIRIRDERPWTFDGGDLAMPLDLDRM